MEDEDTEDMKYCKVCLVTDCKMFSSPSISKAYSQLAQNFFYELYVCYECKHLLIKYQEFKSKCMTALKLLSTIRSDHSKIPKRIVRDIDRKHFKLESKVSRSSTLLVCNSNSINEQSVLPDSQNLYTDIKNEIDTSPDALEDDKSDTKFDIIAKGKEPFSDSNVEIDTNPDTLGNYKREKKINIDAEGVFSDIETQNTDYPNEIIQASNAPNKMLPEIKSEQKYQLTSKKSKEKVPKKIKTLKRITKKRNLPLCASSMQMMKNYATIDVMTPSEAKEEMLLRKESRNYKTNPYLCDLCYKGFTLESTYKKHMKQHSPDSGTVECDFCHMFFRIRIALVKHITGCHKYKIACKSCPYVCFSPSQARTHFAIHKGKTYTCKLCGKNFRYSNSLSTHKRKNHPDIACAYCGSMFAELAGLKIHKSRAHNQDSTELLGPKCEECDVQFATEIAWKRHLVLSSKHTVINGCEDCGESFLTADELRRHTKEHPGMQNRAQYAKVAKLYKQKFKAACKLCNKRLETNAEYEEHMKSEHPNFAEICEVCGKVLKDSTKLLGPKCEECDILFATETVSNGEDYCETTKDVKIRKNTYRRKRQCHNIYIGFTPPAACEICDKWLSTRRVYRQHMKSDHPTSDAAKRIRQKEALELVCEICGMVVKCNEMLETGNEYRKHLKSAHPGSDIAKKIEKRYLNRNRCRFRTESSPVVCEVCGKVSKNLYLLRIHQLTHTDKRPFECGECGKKFAQSSSLSTHKNVHTRTHVYECDMCQKQYSRKDGLTKHIKYHFGIRPYKCSYCHKSFIYNCQRRMHIEYVHNSKPWPQRDRSKRSAKMQSVLQ